MPRSLPAGREKARFFPGREPGRRQRRQQARHAGGRVGLIGAGMQAVPVLTTSGAYALSEAFGWKYGLGRNPARAPQFYFVIVLSTLAAMEINYLGINPVAALFWTSVL